MNRLKNTEHENVMIIEDETDLCFLLSHVLKKNDLSSRCFNTITEAKKVITDIKPSLIFLDNNLPDGYGSDFITTLKALCPFAKIIMMTAYDSPSDVQIAFCKGADYFIGKPFNASSIKRTIDLLKSDSTKSHLSS